MPPRIFFDFLEFDDRSRVDFSWFSAFLDERFREYFQGITSLQWKYTSSRIPMFN